MAPLIAEAFEVMINAQFIYLLETVSFGLSPDEMDDKFHSLQLLVQPRQFNGKVVIWIHI